MAIHPGILAWRIPWTEGWLQSIEGELDTNEATQHARTCEKEESRIIPSYPEQLEGQRPTEIEGEAIGCTYLWREDQDIDV